MAMPNIMSMFSNMTNKSPVQSQGPNQAPVPVATQATVIPSQAPNGGANNPANAVNQQAAPGTTGSVANVDKNLPINGDKQAQPSPLDQFKDIWSPPKQDSTPDISQYSYPKLDPSKLVEGIAKMDFTRNISPELFQKATGGDAIAMKQMLNQVAQEAFSTSFQASDRYNKQIFDTYDKSVAARIPKEVGRREVDNLIKQSFKGNGMDHPAIAPVIDVITKQMRQHYPEASAQEIADASKMYLKEIAPLITRQSESDANNQSQQVRPKSKVITDFSNFLEG